MLQSFDFPHCKGKFYVVIEIKKYEIRPTILVKWPKVVKILNLRTSGCILCCHPNKITLLFQWR